MRRLSRPMSLSERQRGASCGLVAALAGLLAGACGPGAASPIPQPPILAVPIDRVYGKPPSIDDPGRLPLPLLGCEKGCVPGGALVRVIDLDKTTDPVTVVAESDGSFAISADVEPGDELRLDFTLNDERSQPSDAIVADDYGLMPSPRFDCITLDPYFSLETSATTMLTFQSSCADDTAIDNARLRLGLPDFAVASTLPLVIPAGDSAELEITFEPRAAGEREDVLFLDLTSGADTIRYPISLYSPK